MSAFELASVMVTVVEKLPYLAENSGAGVDVMSVFESASIVTALLRSVVVASPSL